MPPPQFAITAPVTLPPFRVLLHSDVAFKHLQEAISSVKFRVFGAKVFMNGLVRRAKVVHIWLPLARSEEGKRWG